MPAQLTLARQYISDDDPRVQLSAWAALLRTENRLAKGRRDGWETPWTQMSQLEADLTEAAARGAQRKCCQSLVTQPRSFAPPGSLLNVRCPPRV